MFYMCGGGANEKNVSRWTIGLFLVIGLAIFVPQHVKAAFQPTAGYTAMLRKSKAFELRTQSKQTSFDTMQGGCTDGTYAYFVLYNRTRQCCKISKVRMSDWKVVKVSKIVNVNHGNDITYNTRTKELVVVHWSGYELRLSNINPSSLLVTSYRDIKIPEKVNGLSDKLKNKVKRIYGIAYNSSKNQYVVGVSSLSDFMILDQDFQVVRYCETTVKLDYTRQGLDTEGNYIYLAESPGGENYNILAVYGWNGNYITKIKIRKSLEIENIFHANGKYYAGFYTSGYKKVKGKKTLVRSNYVYRLEFKRAATIEYRTSKGKGRISNSTLHYGIPMKLRNASFKRKGYKFKGWKAYRSQDKKYYGYNKRYRLGWYKKSQIKKYKLYKNKATISKTASRGTVRLYAQWKKK